MDRRGRNSLVLVCAYCFRRKDATRMVKAGSTPFCTPLHATLYLKNGQSSPKHAWSKATGAMLDALINSAVEKIVLSLQLRRPVPSEARSRTPSPQPYEELDKQAYAELLAQFDENKLWLGEAFAEVLRSAVEAELEVFSSPNQAIAIQGPVQPPERDELVNDFDIVRGAASYFVVRVGGVPRRIMRVTPSSTPVYVTAVRVSQP